MDASLDSRTSFAPEVPTEEDSKLAAEAIRALAGAIKAKKEVLRVKLDDGQQFTLPKAATRLLSHLLNEMANGNAVTLIPIHAELTTQEAADYLNVSRPYLIRQLESHKVPFHKVGTHRRIKFQDLEVYRQSVESERRKVMDELAEQAQELEMGY
jgi:excisionase family DNA binding protein